MITKYIPLLDEVYKNYEPQKPVPGTFEWALYMKMKLELDRPTLRDFFKSILFNEGIGEKE